MNRLPWLIVGAAGIGLVLFLLYNLQSEAQTPSPAATTPVRPAGPQDAPTSLGGPSAVERPVRESPPPAPAPAPDKPPQAAPAPTAPAVAGAPGGTLRGKVMAPSGQPMAGAAVVARRQDTQLFGFQSYGDPLGTGQTDATGEFVLASVPPGRDVHLFVTTKEHAPAKFTGLVVKEGEETQVPTIFLKDGGSISGAVSGDPGASKAEVVVAPFSLFSMGNDVEELRTKTDERGRYRVARVPAGKVRVTVRGEGLAQQSRYEVEVQDGQETTGIDFQVTTGKSVVGTVRCDSGPLEGVRVLASPVDFTSNAPGEAKTGPDGRFEIRHLSGEEYNVVASKKGYQTPSRISVFPGGNEIEIRLEPNCSIKGRVVDETTGQPVRGFSVRWGRSRNGRTSRPPRASSRSRTSSRGSTCSRARRRSTRSPRAPRST
jgi:hypothetical protein